MRRLEIVRSVCHKHLYVQELEGVALVRGERGGLTSTEGASYDTTPGEFFLKLIVREQEELSLLGFGGPEC